MKLIGSFWFAARSLWLLAVVTLCSLGIAPRATAQLVGSGGLTGKYYNGTSFNTLALTRIDSMVDFDWGSGSPGSGVNTNNISVRWTGMLQPRYSEPYYLYVEDGGFATKVWINGVSVIDTTAFPYSRTGVVRLKAGQLYPIKIEGVHTTGNAAMRLLWESPTQLKEGVPSQFLFPTELTAPSAPVAHVAYQLDSGFTAEWAQVAGATSYRLDVSTDSQFGSFVSGYNNLNVGNVTQQAVTGLAKGHYYYRVRAVWSGGTTASSNTVSATAVGITLISSQTYSSAGNSTYTVPSGANRIMVKVWGAGGDGTVSDNNSSEGGGGGFVTAAYTVTANQTVNVQVGSATSRRSGGASAVWRVGGFQLVAGGGGAGGYGNAADDAPGASGAAGGFYGADGGSGSGGGTSGGTGASRFGPGIGGYISSESGTSGGNGGGPLNLSGGGSYSHNGGTCADGGDGGGGYYGGGGAAYRSGHTGGAGGGGSNYLDLTNGYVAGTGNSLSGNGSEPAATTDADYPGSDTAWGFKFENADRGAGYVLIRAYSVEVPPAISTQPSSVMVANVGDSASFTVAASGYPAVSYQWKKNGTNISGATSSTYTISSVQTTDVATYTVAVSNAWGSVTSNGALLAIDTPPGAPPWNGYLEKTDKTVTITWGAASDNVGISHYIVERGSSPTQIGTTTELVFTDVGLTANTAYLYQVKAVDTAGKTSAASSQLSVTTDASATADADGDGVPDSVETALGTVSAATNANASQVPNNIHRPRL